MTILTINTGRYLDSALHASVAGTRSHDAAVSISGKLNYSGGMAGWDVAGMDWAEGYDSYAAPVLDGVQDLAMGCSDTSHVLTIVAGNYLQAEHVASLGASLLTHPAFAPAVEELCIAPPPKAAESANPGFPPEGWHLVQELASLTWSSVSELHARDLKLLNERSLLMDSAASELANAARNIGASCTAYAVSVEEAHTAIRNLAQELMWEITATVAVGAALTIFSGGLSTLIGAGVAAARIHRFVASVRVVLEGLTAAARASRAARVVMSSAVRLRGLAGSAKPHGASSPRRRRNRGGLHLLGFTAVGNTKLLTSVKWGKAAQDRIFKSSDGLKIAQEGKPPWLVRKSKNYPGLPKKLPVIVPQGLRAAHPGPAPSRRTVAVKPLPVIRASLPPVLDNPLLIRRFCLAPHLPFAIHKELFVGTKTPKASVSP